MIKNTLFWALFSNLVGFLCSIAHMKLWDGTCLDQLVSQPRNGFCFWYNNINKLALFGNPKLGFLFLIMFVKLITYRIPESVPDMFSTYVYFSQNCPKSYCFLNWLVIKIVYSFYIYSHNLIYSLIVAFIFLKIALNFIAFWIA